MIKHRVLSGLAALLMLTGVTACGQSGPSPSSDMPAMSGAATDTTTDTTGEANAMSDPTATVTGSTVATAGSGTTKAPTKAPSKDRTTTTTTATKGNAPLLSGKISLNAPALTGDQTTKMLFNPDRGFRLEAYYNVLTGNGYPSNTGVDAYTFFDSLLYDYAADYPQLSQLFFYVTEYYNRDFDQVLFDKLNEFFQHAREKKIRLLIRFVYQWDETDKVSGPTPQQIIRHIQQLGPIIEKNRDVIHCWQAGFIGLWGEWHNSIYPMTDQDKADILTALVDNSPADLFIQTRMVEYRDTVPDSDPRKARISYHDDYLTGEPNRWSCGLTPGDPAYERMISQSSQLLIDGEMPWGNDKQMGEKFNGLSMAKYLSERHYTSMSLIHNYRDAGPCTMTYWQDQYITAPTLDANGLRYSPAWFRKADGSVQRKTIFEYIQQHLGYYLEANAVQAISSDKTVQASAEIMNYGFAAPLGMKSFELVLVDEAGKIVSSKSVAAMADFQPGQKVKVQATLTVPNPKAKYRLGIRFVNSAGTGARLANEVDFTDNVNLFGYVR